MNLHKNPHLATKDMLKTIFLAVAASGILTLLLDVGKALASVSWNG